VNRTKARGGQVVLLLFALPVLARVIAFAVDPHAYFYTGDSFEYLSFISPVTNKPVGYNLFVELCCMVLGRGLSSILLVQGILGVVTAYLLYLVCVRGLGLGRRVAMGVYLACGLWPVNIVYEHAILSETLFGFLLAALLGLVFSVRRRGRGAAWVGVALGLVCITRTIGMVLVPVVFVALLLPHARLRLRGRLLRVLWAALACSAIIIPYASVFYSQTGTFALTAFRGRTMFPHVATLVDVDAIEDEEFRKILQRRRHELSWAPRDRLRWDWNTSPLSDGFHLMMERNPPSEVSPHDPLASDHDVYGPMRSVAAFDRTLATLVDKAIAADPIGYARLVGHQLKVLVLDVGGTSSVESLFQSREREAWVDPNGSLRRVLEDRYGYALPARGQGALQALVTSAFDGRFALLLVIAGVLGWLVWSRVLGVDHVILALFAGVVTLAPILAQEYYGRYFVPATNLLFLLLGAGIARLAPRVQFPTLSLAIAAHVAYAVYGPWIGFPQGWDHSLTDRWGGGAARSTTYGHNSVGLRHAWNELLVVEDAVEGENSVRISGHFRSPGGVYALLYADPDGDGTPPDSAEERDRGVDLSHGLTELRFFVKGSCDPDRVRVSLKDRRGLNTTGSRGAPALTSFLPEGPSVDTWSLVRIPMTAFPPIDDTTQDESGTGPVDFTRIVAVVLTIECAQGCEDQLFDLLVDDMRFEGARTVLWVQDDDTNP
jgi:hypothetical protein